MKALLIAALMIFTTAASAHNYHRHHHHRHYYYTPGYYYSYGPGWVDTYYYSAPTRYYNRVWRYDPLTDTYYRARVYRPAVRWGWGW